MAPTGSDDLPEMGIRAHDPCPLLRQPQRESSVSAGADFQSVGIGYGDGTSAGPIRERVGPVHHVPLQDMRMLQHDSVLRKGAFPLSPGPASAVHTRSEGAVPLEHSVSAQPGRTAKILLPPALYAKFTSTVLQQLPQSLIILVGPYLPRTELQTCTAESPLNRPH